jgi:hypothetical protein
MLGITILNEIVNKNNPQNAAQLLDMMRLNLKNALHQNGHDNSTTDGMDCALCMIDFENNYLHFAGANNPLYIIRNNQIIEIAGDRMPIGVHVLKRNSVYKP